MAPRVAKRDLESPNSFSQPGIPPRGKHPARITVEREGRSDVRLEARIPRPLALERQGFDQLQQGRGVLRGSLPWRGGPGLRVLKRAREEGPETLLVSSRLHR